MITKLLFRCLLFGKACCRPDSSDAEARSPSIINQHYYKQAQTFKKMTTKACNKKRLKHANKVIQATRGRTKANRTSNQCIDKHNRTHHVIKQVIIKTYSLKET
jgi:hypothetical protein